MLIFDTVRFYFENHEVEQEPSREVIIFPEYIQAVHSVSDEITAIFTNNGRFDVRESYKEVFYKLETALSLKNRRSIGPLERKFLQMQFQEVYGCKCKLEY